jgi:hypothetical protein
MRHTLVCLIPWIVHNGMFCTQIYCITFSAKMHISLAVSDYILSVLYFTWKVQGPVNSSMACMQALCINTTQSLIKKPWLHSTLDRTQDLMCEASCQNLRGTSKAPTHKAALRQNHCKACGCLPPPTDVWASCMCAINPW